MLTQPHRDVAAKRKTICKQHQQQQYHPIEIERGGKLLITPLTSHKS